MFTKQRNRTTERERERKIKRVGCLGMSLMFVSLLFRFPPNLSNALTLLYNPEMTSCSFSLIFFLPEFQHLSTLVTSEIPTPAYIVVVFQNLVNSLLYIPYVLPYNASS